MEQHHPILRLYCACTTPPPFPTFSHPPAGTTVSRRTLTASQDLTTYLENPRFYSSVHELHLTGLDHWLRRPCLDRRNGLERRRGCSPPCHVFGPWSPLIMHCGGRTEEWWREERAKKMFQQWLLSWCVADGNTKCEDGWKCSIFTEWKSTFEKTRFQKQHSVSSLAAVVRWTRTDQALDEYAKGSNAWASGERQSGVIGHMGRLEAVHSQIVWNLRWGFQWLGCWWRESRNKTSIENGDVSHSRTSTAVAVAVALDFHRGI